jgi:hypothetical protein
MKPIDKAQQAYDAMLPDDDDMPDVDCNIGMHDWGVPRLIQFTKTNRQRGQMCLECGAMRPLDEDDGQ